MPAGYYICNMRYAGRHLEQAVQLVQAYEGIVPLAVYLKQYFVVHKKHGSKDRKSISHLCYCYYRLGHALKHLPVAERLKLALFLCSDSLDSWAALFEPAWQQQHQPLLAQRLAFAQTVYPGFRVTDIFPWLPGASEGLEHDAFAASHLVQPKVFLRIRPGYEKSVVQQLGKKSVAFEQVSTHCIALPPGSAVQELLALNREAVVQDYSSQRVGTLLDDARQAFHFFRQGHDRPPLRVWDCCAASGGKSILAWDILPSLNLSVSDVRPSILYNLQQRFSEAGISSYRSFVADLAKPLSPVPGPYDLVICDAPCSGSGTWSRTPEQLYFFSDQALEKYAALQRRILNHTVPAVKKGGYFLYITCSVLQAENEQQAAHLLALGLQPVKQELLKGYPLRADSMFAALFKKA